MSGRLLHLKKIARDSRDSKELEVVLAHAELHSRDSANLMLILAANPHLTGSQLARLSKIGDDAVCLIIAGNERVLPETLEVLAHHASDTVKKRAAKKLSARKKY